MKKRFYCIECEANCGQPAYIVVDSEDNSIEWYLKSQLSKIKPQVEAKGFGFVILGQFGDQFGDNCPYICHYFGSITSKFINRGCFEPKNFKKFFKSYAASLDLFYNMCMSVMTDPEDVPLAPFLIFKTESPQAKEPMAEFMCSPSTEDALRGIPMVAFNEVDVVSDIAFRNNAELPEFFKDMYTRLENGERLDSIIFDDL